LPLRHRPPRRPRRRPIVVLAALALVGALAAACRDAALGFGPSPAVARQNADLAFGALAARFAATDRQPKADEARRRLYRNALVPSRAFADTGAWTDAPSAELRTLLVGGEMAAGGRYRLVASPAVPTPNRIGDSRHLVALQRLDEDEYRWATGVDFAMGPVGARNVGLLFGRLLASAERRSESDMRADYVAAVPRAAAALGTLCSLDTLRPTSLVDGTTMVTLVVGVHPERLDGRYPQFGRWLAKYVATGRMRMTLRDGSGAPWILAAARDGSVRLTARVLRGELVPLSGAARAMPDTMQLEMDMTTRVKIFTVGFRHLVTDFVVVRRDGERSWQITARREPEWELPLVAERLLRTPLRRPFQGSGANFRIGVRDVGGQTLLWRSAELAVQESAILRFLNGLGSTMMGDFDLRSELERDAWLHDAFVALRADVRALPAGAALR
jgi:hypothetical protein